MKAEYIAGSVLAFGALWFIGRKAAIKPMMQVSLQRLANEYAGVDAKKDPAKFKELVAPMGPAGAAQFFLMPNVKDNANSSCGVVAVGLFKKLAASLGVSFPELDKPLTLDWWTPVVELAKQVPGAYHQDDKRPTLGAIVHVEGGGPGRHWYTVIDDDGKNITSIDGGFQTAGGYQAIQKTPGRTYRTISTPQGTRLYDNRSSKNVYEWVDTFALIAAKVL